MTTIKFCGLTREIDAELAVELGAAFVGAVFAGGPRRVTGDRARSVLAHAGDARRVGVFGNQTVEEISRIAEVASLDVVQLHADPTTEKVSAVRSTTGLETWAAVRIANQLDEGDLDSLISSADAVLFDTRVEGALGGTGQAFDWTILTNLLNPHRRAKARVILAGGLTPASVAGGIRTLRPDVVDVSSGVEASPGIKDHTLMRAFAAAVRSAS
jgi:phosphoribosylanthranilate isomerase